MTPAEREQEKPDDLTSMTVVAAEGARVGFVVCKECGAAILLDPREQFDAAAVHRDWHHVSRPDPRGAFISG